jgi:hypothetical protein
MSTIAAPTLGEVENWFGYQHATITFCTESGSRYTLVSRPGIRVLVRDSTAEAWKGKNLRVNSDGSIELLTTKGTTWTTTPVTSFYVLSN